MSNYTVSIIVPTKNSSRTLEECLISINSQAYKKIELIVVDNYSDDKTLSIAKKYTRNIYLKGPERSTQRNYGVKKASGKYVMIIDSDMKLSSDVVEKCVNKIKNNDETSGIIIPEESFGKGFWAQCKKLERSFYIGIPYMEAARFFRRKDYLDIGGYNETLVSGEDWDLSQKIEELGKINRIDSYIYHDEGHVSLCKLIKKKFYYAEKFVKYIEKNKAQKKPSQQTSITRRYGLFFSNPKKLFNNPLLGIGMLFMKTCEFGFGGAGYLKAKIQSK